MPQDYAAAATWYRKAAEQGNVHAQHNLGDMYVKGQGLPQDYAAAEALYRKAAEQGWVPGDKTIKLADERPRKAYLSAETTGPETASVTPESPPSSSSVSRNELRGAFVLGRASMHA